MAPAPESLHTRQIMQTKRLKKGSIPILQIQPLRQNAIVVTSPRTRNRAQVFRLSVQYFMQETMQPPCELFAFGRHPNNFSHHIHECQKVWIFVQKGELQKPTPVESTWAKNYETPEKKCKTCLNWAIMELYCAIFL